MAAISRFTSLSWMRGGAEYSCPTSWRRCASSLTVRRYTHNRYPFEMCQLDYHGAWGVVDVGVFSPHSNVFIYIADVPQKGGGRCIPQAQL